MEDKLVQRMKYDRGIIDRMMAWIPGFKGYLENTTLWEADRMVREEVARRITGLKNNVNAAIKAASADIRSGDRIAEYESLLSRIEGLSGRIRIADYGHSQMFAKVVIDGDDLSRLLAHDRDLLDNVDHLERLAGDIALNGVSEFSSELERFEENFASRKKVLMEFAKEN